MMGIFFTYLVAVLETDVGATLVLFTLVWVKKGKHDCRQERIQELDYRLVCQVCHPPKSIRH